MTITVRVATRPSMLARAQTKLALKSLRGALPDVSFEVVAVRTEGDARQDEPLRAFGDKAVFATAIEKALIDGRADIAVHSLKDLPLELPSGLWISTYLEREDPRDAVVSPTGACLADLEPHARVGTSSARRRGQLRELRPDLEFVDIRGNVDTRLRKLSSGEFDAIILAAAGLLRLGLGSQITEALDPAVCTPAPGQGIVALECRENYRLSDEIASASDPSAAICARAERRLAGMVSATCSTAFGALAERAGERLRIQAWLDKPAGSARVDRAGTADSWQEVVEAAASALTA